MSRIENWLKNHNYVKIILLGFKASGKSFIGKILSKKLNWKFFDMDDEIKNRTKLNIKELTKDNTDWTLFRKIETDILQDLLDKKNIIISAGGGVGVNNVKYNNKTFG